MCCFFIKLKYGKNKKQKTEIYVKQRRNGNGNSITIDWIRVEKKSHVNIRGEKVPRENWHTKWENKAHKPPHAITTAPIAISGKRNPKTYLTNALTVPSFLDSIQFFINRISFPMRLRLIWIEFLLFRIARRFWDEYAAEAEPGGCERPRRGSQKTDRHPRRMRRRALLSHVLWASLSLQFVSLRNRSCVCFVLSTSIQSVLCMLLFV